jgi:hypothetical protein
MVCRYSGMVFTVASACASGRIFDRILLHLRSPVFRSQKWRPLKEYSEQRYKIKTRDEKSRDDKIDSI